MSSIRKEVSEKSVRFPGERGGRCLAKNRLDYLKLSLIRPAAYRVWRKKAIRYGTAAKGRKPAILEVGCGQGFFLRSWKKWFHAWRLFGSDIHFPSLAAAARMCRGALLVCHDAKMIPFGDSGFDILCAFQVVEHISDPDLFFGEAHRVLREDGLLLLATPNPSGITARLLKERWIGVRADHVSLRRPSQWRSALEASGFRVLDDGTTGLTRFPVLKWLPFSLLNWVPMAIVGYFRWEKGESYMAVARKSQRSGRPLRLV
jgi:2-polyprenyl-6-hydroxyphenyl methylase/3-demethylubiquinone-9 3-methyltransferase